MYYKPNSKEIEEVVKHYLNQKDISSAIMIDGEWGCGKTFFINDRFVNNPEYKSKKRFVYISAYGISDESEFEEKMMNALINTINNEKTRFATQITKKLAGIVKEWKGIKTTFLTIDFILEKINNNLVLVFDDIERCEMSINSLLGIINNFVEHKKIHTILIANQKEISNNQFDDNIELKYLAAYNMNVEFKEKEKTNEDPFLLGIDSDESKTDSKMDINTLNMKTEAIFKSNCKYERIKEKLIGKELLFIPDMSLIFDLLVETHIKSNRVKEIITKEKDNILKLNTAQKNCNIRTIEFFMQTIQDIVELIPNNKYESPFEILLLENVIIYTCYTCISFKNGNELDSWSSEIDCKITYISPFGYTDAFKFVDDFILNGYVDNNSISSIVDSYYNKWKNDSDSDTTWREIKYYWEMDDKEVLSIVSRIINLLKDNRISILNFEELLFYMFLIKKIGLA